MEFCSNCFKRRCRCGKPKIEIDYYIYPAIYELNRKGYRTGSCCSGHPLDPLKRTYVHFLEDLDVELNLEHFQFESYSYRGIHVRRNCILLKPEIVHKLNKKRTNKLELIQNANKELYVWAQSLPPRIDEPWERIVFPDSYFGGEVTDDEIIDIQKPWVIFANAGNGCKFAADDFFDEIECEGELTEIVVNQAGQIKQFFDSDYISNMLQHGRHSLLEEKIKFDITGDYRLLLCGYEPYVTVEKLLVGEAIWYLSYARTDIAFEYGDGEESYYGEDFCSEYEDYEDYHPAKEIARRKRHTCVDALFDEYDIEDFFADHQNGTELDLFTFLFNRMCRMNINTCVFSSDNVNIVFSNKTDFSLLLLQDRNVFAFGKAEYEYMDFPRVCVDHKELFVYANNRLLLRKVVE